MSLSKFGDIVDTSEGSGVLKATNCLLAIGTTTLALSGFKADGGNAQEILAVQTHARVNKTKDDFVDTVHLYSPVDAGALAGMIAAGCNRLGPEAFEEFQRGFDIGLSK